MTNNAEQNVKYILRIAQISQHSFVDTDAVLTLCAIPQAEKQQISAWYKEQVNLRKVQIIRDNQGLLIATIDPALKVADESAFLFLDAQLSGDVLQNPRINIQYAELMNHALLNSQISAELSLRLMSKIVVYYAFYGNYQLPGSWFYEIKQLSEKQIEDRDTLIWSILAKAVIDRLQGNYIEALKKISQLDEFLINTVELSLPIILAKIEEARNFEILGQYKDALNTYIAFTDVNETFPPQLRNYNILLNLLKQPLLIILGYFRMVDGFNKEAEKKCGTIEELPELLQAYCLTEQAVLQMYRGKYDDSLSGLKTALRLFTLNVGKNSVPQANTYMNMAMLYLRKTNTGLAKTYTRKAITIFEKNKNGAQMQTAMSYSALTFLHCQFSHPITARKWIKKTDIFFNEHFAQNHPLQYQNELHQAILNINSNFDEALGHFKKALKIHRTHFIPHHPQAATILRNIAFCQHQLGQTKHALKTLAEAEAVMVVNKEMMLLEYSVLLMQKARIFLDSNDAVRAEQNLQKVRTLQARLFGENHLILAHTYLQMALTSELQKKWQAAKEYANMALGIMQGYYSENAPEMSDVYNIMARVYSKAKNMKAAIPLAKKNLNLLKNSTTINYNKLLAAYLLLSDFYLFTGELKIAWKNIVETEKAMHEAKNNKNKINPILLGRLYSNIGLIYAIRGKVSDAQDYLKKSIAIFSAPGSYMPQLLAESYLKLIHVLRHKRQRAINSEIYYYKQALKILKKLEKPPYRPRIARMYITLGGLYFELEQYDKAMEQLMHIIQNEDLYPVKNLALTDVYNSIAAIYLAHANFRDCLHYLELSHETYSQFKKPDYIEWAYNSYLLARTNLLQYDYKKGFHYLDKALDMSQKVPKRAHNDRLIYYSFAHGLYRDIKDDEKADIYLAKIKEILKSHHFFHNRVLLETFYSLTVYYFKINQIENAREYAEKVGKIARRVHDMDSLEAIELLKIEMQRKTGLT